MRRYSVGHTTKLDDKTKEIMLIDAPRWTEWPILLGYRLMRLTNDKLGLWLVAHGGRVRDRRARVFAFPVTRETFEEFQRWKKQSKVR